MDTTTKTTALPLRALVLVALSITLAATHTVALAVERVAPAVPLPASNPLPAATLAPEERFTFEGRVEERLDAGSYVYLRVGGVWVATLAATASDAPLVRVTAIGRARDFESRRLGRRFDVLVFGIVRAASPAALREE